MPRVHIKLESKHFVYVLNYIRKSIALKLVVIDRAAEVNLRSVCMFFSLFIQCSLPRRHVLSISSKVSLEGVYAPLKTAEQKQINKLFSMRSFVLMAARGRNLH